MPMAESVTNCEGWTIRLTPPTSAASQAPERRLSIARCSAVNDDEHAVSTAMLGPWKSNRYETRLAIDQ